MNDIYDCLKRFLKAFSFAERLPGSLVRLMPLASNMNHLADAYESKGLGDKELRRQLEEIVANLNPEWDSKYPELLTLKRLLKS